MSSDAGASVWRGPTARVAGIFVLALVLRLAYLSQIATVPFVEVPVNDAREYDLWAQEIAAGDWWGSEAFYQAPTYPYFLAVVYAVAGHDLHLVHVLHMVMGAFTCVLLFLLTRTLFGEKVGLVAALMLAVYPPAIFFDGVIGKATLGLLMFTGLLALLARFQREPRFRDALLAGIVLGLLALTRENALAFAVAIPIWIAFRFGDASVAERGRWVGAFVLGAALILGSVGLRNYIVGDSFVVTTSQMGTNFWIGNNPNATGLYAPLIPGRNTPTHEASDAANLAERALGRPLNRAEVSSYWMDRGIEFVGENPLAFLRLLLRKTLYTWTAFEISDTEDIYAYADWSWLLRGGLAVFHFGILAPLALAGLAFAWRNRDASLLWWLAVSYTGAVALFLAFARFRYPLVPLLLPLAALAVVRFAEGVRGGRGGGWKELRVPAAVLVVSGLCLNATVVDEERMRSTSYVNLAGIMLNERREEAARPYLDRAAALHGESPDLHFHYAVYYFRLDRFDEAERHLREMIALDDSDVRGHRLMMAVLKRQGRLQEARAAARRVRELDPDAGVRHPPKENAPTVKPRDEAAP